MEVVRTRDEAVIATGDWVVDIGSVYDPERRRFDHHQDDAPVRENGIPYAAFGLLWQHLGEALCGSKAIAELIEVELVIPVDANDVGVNLYELTSGFAPFEVHDVVGLFKPVWESDEDTDVQFQSAVTLAAQILSRAIEKCRGKVKMQEYARSVYEASKDTGVLEFDTPVSADLFIEYPEVKAIVQPEAPQYNDNWCVVCIKKTHGDFTPRVKFPRSWASLRGEELQQVSGIDDAIFCHKTRFFFVAKSKEGARAAALQAKEELE